ncbi:hypothetical protein Taro_005388 [Colocasia esculenta]|uniref:Pentatricopeptide repeat-containing protein n=1 Tax=Colocasia esculenta TaxID=4460 RepID=A0A843TS84_COLES|nr:hypothetical protein [Colocasia esculenta]
MAGKHWKETEQQPSPSSSKVFTAANSFLLATNSCITATSVGHTKCSSCSSSFLRTHILGSIALNIMVALGNVVSYTTLIKGFCSRGNVNMALELLREMVVGGSSCKPYVVTYSTMVGGLCNAGSPDDSLRLIEEMDADGVPPNTITYGTLIRGLSMIRKVGMGPEILRDMSQRDQCCNPNVVIYSMLIDGFCKEGSMADALELLKEMKNVGISPNAITYNTLINGFCRSGDTSMAFQLLTKMATFGDCCKPDVVTYSTIINGLCNTGFLEEALSVVEEMNAQGISPNLVTYRTLINGLCTVGNTDRALVILRGMGALNRNYKPDVVVYNMDIIVVEIVAWEREKEEDGRGV